jgi:hypothetical protein
MALNTITIDFMPCEPTPVNGYRIYYRPVGGGAYRFHPDRFYVTPAVFTDEEDPIGTSYEGFIQGDCGGEKYGLPIPWSAENSESGSGGGSGSGSEPPEVPCRTYILSKTVGTPSAHYIDCAGNTQDTLINSMTSICTNGHGFTISGGGITVNSFTDGDCGGVCSEGCGEYQATGEATDGTEFTWVDCSGAPGSTFIAFNATFNFCTCDASPQYSTSNVTVVRVGDCP